MHNFTMAFHNLFGLFELVNPRELTFAILLPSFSLSSVAWQEMKQTKSAISLREILIEVLMAKRMLANSYKKDPLSNRRA